MLVGDIDTPLVASYNLTGMIATGEVGYDTNQGKAEELTASDTENDVCTNTQGTALDVVYTLVPVAGNG